MISLVLLPVLCLWAMEWQGVFDKNYVLLGYSSHSIPDSIPQANRTYKNYKLSGNTAKDDLTHRLFKSEFLKLEQSKDVSKGIHLAFSETLPYARVVEAIDLCPAEAKHFWITNASGIWVYYPELKKPISDSEAKIIKINARPLCGNIYNQPKPEKAKPQPIFLFFNGIAFPISDDLIIGFGFFLHVFSSIFRNWKTA